jgi:putative ABC transport system permease protein
MIRFESIFYGLKGLLWGLPLSFLVAVGLNKINGTMLATQFMLPWKSYIVAVLMIFVIVSVTMLYSARRIKRENIIDALREENL